MLGSEVLKCDYDVTEVIDLSLKDESVHRFPIMTF